MRILKLAIISAIVLFLVVTAISLLLPSKVLVSRAVDLRSSREKLKQQLFNLQNWQNWMTDAKGGKGEHISIGENGISINNTKVHVIFGNDSTLRTDWRGNEIMIGTFRLIDHHRPDSLLTVQWQMEQHVKWYPWQKFASIIKDELWGGSMEKSLDNLKALIETQ